MSKSKSRNKAKQPSPIIIRYEMVAAQKFLPYLGTGRFSYSKNLAALRQIYKGNGATILFSQSPVARLWTISFTTNAADIGTGVMNENPHFISMQLDTKVMASAAVILAAQVWIDHVKPELEQMSLREVSVDVVLRA
ncbi:hypothetical protein [Acinetobacter radioresistens]|uniref:hypothetical protein n=2 Tax=Acinetobacter radioresistens TaxID=40216 RepID=UPI00200422E7|nr:hypothetical protein [Acinetobacter radioresistens]MCK4108873.1 hypothetical protein [Acinetobacter radioresistens]